MIEQVEKRVFSGVQPTGNLQLGNYLGAIKRFSALQSSYQCIYCIVDLHAITAQWINPDDLKRQTREVAAAYLATGIDPENHTIFVQSQVSEHAELAWILNCVARMGWLNRMTQFKDKAGKNSEHVSVGLFDYPVLMAADILLYRSHFVPVGEDQKQHLELSRDVAQKFNNDWAEQIMKKGYKGGFFPVPEPLIQGSATRVMSLRDGAKKMSKSDPSDLSRINLTDDADMIAQKIRKAKTDAEPLPENKEGFKGRPEAENLMTIYSALTDTPMEDLFKTYGGSRFSDFKVTLTEAAVEHLAPINNEMKRLLNDSDLIDALLREGAEKARHIASETMKSVKDIVGFLR